MECLQPPQIILPQLHAAGIAHLQGLYGGRERLLGLCRSMIASVEFPIESLQRMWWAEPARNSDCRIAVQLGLFECMRAAERFFGYVGGITAGELAVQAGAQAGENIDPAMISRLMKHLAAMNIVYETDANTFCLAPFSRALADSPELRSGAIVSHDIISPTLNCLPKHLQNTRWRYPIDPNNQPFHVAHRTNLSMAAWCDRDQLYGPALRSYRWTLNKDTIAFPDPKFYPVVERLILPFDPAISEVLLVGIGHVAHVLANFKKEFSHHPGRLVLENIDPHFQYPGGHEDLFDIIRHDIFAAQPIIGAKAYYCTGLRGDDEAGCVRILQQLRLAMVPGYSILLLDEFALPTESASWLVTSMERVESGARNKIKPTEVDFASFIQQAGFMLRRTYYPAFGTTMLMELEVL